MGQSQEESIKKNSESVVENVAEGTCSEPKSTLCQQVTQKDSDPSRHSADARWLKKCQILRLLKEGQLTNEKIAQHIGVHRNTVSRVAALLKKNPNLTNDDLREKHRGPLENPFRKISLEIYLALTVILTTTLPTFFGISYSTWSGKAILELLEKKYNTTVGIKYLYSFLSKVQITSKFAERSNPKRDEQEASYFKNNKYRKRCLRAINNGEEILFADEVHVQCGNHVRGFAPMGEPALMAFNNSSMHSCLSLLVFVGLNGFIRIFEIEGSFTAQNFKDCLKQIKKENPGKKFRIFLDNARVHHAKIVKKWLMHYKGGKSLIKIEFIPAYCPELNPAERWNNTFKEHMRKHYCHNEDEIIKLAREFINPYNKKLKGDDVKKLFMDKKCVYSITEFEKAKKIHKRYLQIINKAI